MKSESWLVIQFGAALLALGLMSFFFTPAYEKGAWAVITVFISVLSAIIGYKFGKSLPEQITDPKIGQSSTPAIETKTQSPPEVSP